MAKKKCYNCGIVDKPDTLVIGHSKLIWDIGTLDLNGLLMHLIYCRLCGAVNVYKPGWFGNIKFEQFFKYDILLDKIKSGDMEPDMLKVITPRIQRAMKEDGVLPSDWEVVGEGFEMP